MSTQLIPTHVFDQAKKAISEVWEKRGANERPVIVVGDATRPEIPTFAEHSPHVEMTVFDAKGTPRKFLVYLQPQKLIQAFEKAGRQIGQDLRQHLGSLEWLEIAGAPVLVALEDTLWATSWSPDGNVIHCHDAPGPESN